MQRGDELVVKIDSLAFGGEGVGRVKVLIPQPLLEHTRCDSNVGEKSFVIFVEDTVPGDVVKVRIGGKKRNYAFGYIVEFIEKAPSRISPRCRHFGIESGAACGGCTLQFLSYEDQLKIKEQQVRDAMVRLGRFDASVVKPIVGCVDPWFYRNKMEFSFSRTKEGELSLGFHVRRRHHDVVELTECFLFAPYVGELVVAVRNFFREVDRKTPIQSGGQTEGVMRLVSFIVREGKHTGEVMANLVVENSTDTDFLEEFKKLILYFFGKEGPAGSKENFLPQKITSLYFTNIINKKGSARSVEEKVLFGEPVIHEDLQLSDGSVLKFEISPQSFFQPNTKQAETLYATAIEAAGLTGSETVFDLFCGAGTIGTFCAKSTKKVYGIELNESAVLNARKNAEQNGVTNIEFLAGDVAKILPTIKERADVIIVDPPRGGLAPDVVEMIANYGPRRVVYVSCNPTTLARDLALFTKTGYTLESVQPVDMFPQTYHIENVAVLERV